jgi:hypothetical protein
MKRVAITFLIGASLALRAVAEGADGTEPAIKKLAEQIKADEARIYAHPQPTDSDRLRLAAQAEQEVAAENRHRITAKLPATPEEALRLAHDKEQREKMKKLDEKLAAEVKKSREVARQYALEAASKWSPSTQLPNSEEVGPNGRKKIYNNEKPIIVDGPAVQYLKDYFKKMDEKEAEQEAREKEEEQAEQDGLK